jgi:hypothetical protein
MLEVMLEKLFGKKIVKQESLEIKPVRQKERYQCPFYGFNLTPGQFLDQGNDQCALIISSDHPCDMKLDNKIPDWNNCYLNNKSNSNGIKEIIENYKTNASEFRPEGINQWKGIPFRYFYDYIMNLKNPKID